MKRLLFSSLVLFGLFVINNKFGPFPFKKINRGYGMAPTIKPIAYILTNAISGHYERGDIILYKDKKGGEGVTRILGLPGERIKMIDKVLYINDIPEKNNQIKEIVDGRTVNYLKEAYSKFPLESLILSKVTLDNKVQFESYVGKFSDRYSKQLEEVTVPKDSYYVIGDNRSFTSNSHYIGFISKDRIKSKYITTLRRKEPL